ncbi:MAG: chemotaxis protein CheA [Candidatus Nitrospinota bacterium M3_3B_026]
MSNPEAASPDEHFQDFLEESEELMAEAERRSIALEADPADFEQVHGIFRAAHSLKGNSAFFDLTHVQSFLHSFENFLDLVRGKRIEITPEVAEFILEGADRVKAIFTRLRNTRADVELSAAEAGYMDRIDEMTAAGAGGTEKLRAELMGFFDRARQEGAMEEGSPLQDVYEIIDRNAPQLIRERRSSAPGDGPTYMMGAADVTREYTSLRKLVEEALAGQAPEDAYAVFMNNLESLMEKGEAQEAGGPLEILNEMKENFEIFYQDELGVDEALAGSLADGLDEYSKHLSEAAPAGEAAPREAEKAGKAGREMKTVRVNETSLDWFMDQVGELVTIRELLVLLQRRLESGETNGLALDFKTTNQAFGELSGKLQKSLYEIRKVPVERAMSKLPRLVRAISKSSGKPIRLQMTGQDVEVDKSMLEKIETILAHLVRNSADHGLETPEERARSGKDPKGTITIEARSGKGEMLLKVSDDGQGVDTGAVAARAVERGIVSREAADRMSGGEILDLLLRPGFSTAERVTETSGRGVGLDVLSSSVKDLNGSLRLVNRPGAGMEIYINLPLTYTTRIKLGLTLKIGDSVFLVPAENVRESFKARPEDVNSVEGRAEVVRRWGRIYPVARLSELFGIESKNGNVWDAVCVLAESRGEPLCMVVDEVLGQRQIVYKELSTPTREPSAFEGVSILDGRRMALILSVEGIIRQFQEARQD